MMTTNCTSTGEDEVFNVEVTQRLSGIRRSTSEKQIHAAGSRCRDDS